jgi:HEAT repeat protein
MKGTFDQTRFGTQEERKGRIAILKTLAKGHKIPMIEEPVKKMAELVKLIRDYKRCEEAVSILCNSPELIPGMIDLFTDDSDNGLKWSSTSVLSETMKKEGMKKKIMPLLLEALSSGDAKLMRGAAETLNGVALHMPITEALPLILSHITHRSKDVRREVLSVLERAGHTENLSTSCEVIFSAITNDKDNWDGAVKAFSAIILNETSRKVALQFLYTKLSSKKETEIDSALDVFGNIIRWKDPLIPIDSKPFTVLFNEGPNGIRENWQLKSIIAELIERGDATGVDYKNLEAMLLNSDHDKSFGVTHILQKMILQKAECGKVIPILEKALESDVAQVRFNALAVLTQEGLYAPGDVTWMTPKLLSLITLNAGSIDCSKKSEVYEPDTTRTTSGRALNVLSLFAKVNPELCKSTAASVLWDLATTSEEMYSSIRRLAANVLRLIYEPNKQDQSVNDQK